MRKFGIAGLLVLLVLALVLVIGGPAIAQDNGKSEFAGGFSLDQSAPGHKIPRGAIVRQLKDGITEIYSPDNLLILKASDSDAATVTTPAGLAKATHVYTLPSGSVIETRGNITEIYENNSLILSVYDTTTLTIPQFSGWIEQANNWSVSNLDNFSANWAVPSNPPNPGMDTVDFLFNAIEPQTGAAILQPVLEWNQAGSHAWTLRSWYGPVNGNYYASSPVNSFTGNSILGTMSYNRQAGWQITTRNVSTSRSTSIRTKAVKTSNLAVFVALEGYNITDTTDVPGVTTFNNMTFKYNRNNINIAWSPLVGIISGLDELGVDIVSSGQVVLRTGN